MISVGADAISQLFIKDMGIKTAAIGNEIIYTRQGGYFYLELNADEKEYE